MKVNAKAIIFVLVVLAVGAIMVIPYLNRGAAKPGRFAVTPDPGGKLKLAATMKRPVFLDFYSAG